MRKTLLVLCLGLGLATGARGENLQLTDGRHWLLLASDKDKDVAIGIARYVRGSLDEARVVLSKNGFYGVIAGPYTANSIPNLKSSDKNGKFDAIPKDALLTNGANYTETVWTSGPDSGGAAVPYGLDKPAQLSAGAFEASVKGEKLGADAAYTVVDGKDEEGSFHFELDKDAKPEEQMTAEAMTTDDFNHAAAVKLLRGASGPQLVITNYTGGAHCCVETTILSRAPGAVAWAAAKLPATDGGGYWFEDVDGDGTQEVLSVDNAFLYAFSSYAESNAPLRVSRFDGARLVDASTEPAMHARLVQDLAGMEFSAKIQPDLWKSNGFLAGWVAAKIRLGQGDAAWAKFLGNHEANSDFGPQRCTTGESLDNCPADKLEPIPIPKGLAQFLKDNGYVPLPQAAETLLK